MKFIQVYDRFIVIVEEDEDLESKITLLKHNDPDIKYEVYDSLEELEQ